MTEPSALTVLQSIVKLVEAPDLRSLDQLLGKTVYQLIPTQHVAVGKIYDHPSIKGQKIVKYLFSCFSGNQEAVDELEGELLKRDTKFFECLTTRSPVITKRANEVDSRLIYPLMGEANVTGFLIIDCKQNVAKDQLLIAMLLNFYKTYSVVLNGSQHDKLTGLLNRKTFEQKISKLISSKISLHGRHTDKKDHVVAFLDIDYFKKVNDQYGHVFGDHILMLFSIQMEEAFREDNLLFRLGGDEFLIVLHNTDLNTGATVLNRFLKEMEKTSYPKIGAMTASIGISKILATDSPTSILHRADRALYHAKNAGGNQICTYENIFTDRKRDNSKETIINRHNEEEFHFNDNAGVAK